MVSKAIYARLQTELYDKVKEHKIATNQSLSSAVEDLIRCGLEKISSSALEDNLEREIIGLKKRVQELETDKASLQGALEACRARESIAMAAQSHVGELEREIEGQKRHTEQLRSSLLTTVATCRNCSTQLRLFDIGQKKCAYCGAWNIEWMPEYKVPPTTWETIRDGAAAIGAAVVIASLLNALASGEGHN